MLEFPRWKVITILLVSFFGMLLSLPNFLSDEQLEKLPSFFPSGRVTLGLDLQGGAHMLMGVDVSEVIKRMLEDKRDNIRDDLRDEKITHRITIRGEELVITLNNAADRDNATRIIRSSIEKVGASMTSIGSDDLVIEDGSGPVINLHLSEAAVIDKKNQTVAQSIEVLRRRIDAMGTKEPTIQQNGEDSVLIQVPGIKDTQELKKIIGTTAQMNFHLTDLTVNNATLTKNSRVPPGSSVLPSYEVDENGNPLFYMAIKNRIMVPGEDLAQANQGIDQDNQIVVNISFNTKGGKLFADATRTNVGKPFAIVLDGKVISAPRINTAILGGSASISGGFTAKEASDLALLLRAGALPAPLTVEEERTVGPDLGADSVEAGKKASIIGLSAVMIFVMLTYGFFGFIVNVALTVNIFMIFGVLSLFGATLTLPGIAGVVLTVGMAVDANVLIFERIREELKRGKSVLPSIEVGYDRALSTIVDANVTTLIAALILFQFGLGPIKGFAVTLAAGIFTSVFTAVSLSRLMIVTWVRKRRPSSLVL
ncbi:MAG: protein translocase subunit SecD [Alphaproteobacteria bacterium]|nr:protein translocase subunit SecD [Alphaproteobacteria bacterium]HPF47591.1 protein translocase subunit SecD [Emcibacteraceae bacterium]